MSQQINLLAPRVGQDRHLLVGGLAVAVALLAVAGWWGVLREETRQVQAQVDAQARQIATLQAELARINAENQEGQQLRQDIASLKPQAEAYKDFLAEVRQGPLGRREGFSGSLEQLGRVPHPETWLTQIDLRHRGVLMTLTGLGLSGAAIAQYAAEINRRYADEGIQLRSLDMSRQGAVPANPGGDGKPALSPLSFKVY